VSSRSRLKVANRPRCKNLLSCTFSMKSYSKHDAGRWQVERERNHIQSPYPQPPPNDPMNIKDVVANVMRRIDVGADPWLADLSTVWGKVAGESVAQHTRPSSFEASCLTVFVDNSVWLNELSRFGMDSLKANLAQHLGDDRIKTIRLKLDPDK
jgi:hypothetical protein